MGNKTLIVLLVSLALTVCLTDAQQPAKVAKIGWLGTRSVAPSYSSESSVNSGYVEGKNIAIEYRSAENKLDRLPALADELVRLKVDVLITGSTAATLAAKNATKTIPIVFLSRSDPVALGLVDSLVFDFTLGTHPISRKGTTELGGAKRRSDF